MEKRPAGNPWPLTDKVLPDAGGVFPPGGGKSLPARSFNLLNLRHLVNFWGGVLSRSKRAQVTASFRPSGPFAFYDPEKLTDGRGSRVLRPLVAVIFGGATSCF